MTASSGSSSQQPTAQLRWSVRPWRFLPPLAVLLTVLYIVATLLPQLLANNPAYPMMLLVVGLVSGFLCWRARPRRRRPRLAYPEPPDAALSGPASA